MFNSCPLNNDGAEAFAAGNGSTLVRLSIFRAWATKGRGPTGPWNGVEGPYCVCTFCIFTLLYLCLNMHDVFICLNIVMYEGLEHGAWHNGSVAPSTVQPICDIPQKGQCEPTGSLLCWYNKSCFGRVLKSGIKPYQTDFNIWTKVVERQVNSHKVWKFTDSHWTRK